MSGDDRGSREVWVCPARHSGALVSWVRRLLQNPDRILAGRIREGQTVLDLGCGPGYFTLPMAKMVEDSGRVIAVDLQQEMLDHLLRRAKEQGLDSRIRLHKAESEKIGLNEAALAEFALAFYMVHEVPDPEAFLREVHGLLKPGGELFVVEPKMHVSKAAFRETVETALRVGFTLLAEWRTLGSRAARFKAGISSRLARWLKRPVEVCYNVGPEMLRDSSIGRAGGC